MPNGRARADTSLGWVRRTTDKTLTMGKPSRARKESSKGRKSGVRGRKARSKASVRNRRLRASGEPIGIVQTEEDDFSFVETDDGEKLFFENYLYLNPYRSLSSQSVSHAIDESGELEYDRAAFGLVGVTPDGGKA